MMKNDITLTPQELEDIKDDVFFRTKVLIELKLMRGVPVKVKLLEWQSGFQWVLILGIIISIVTFALRVWAK